MLDTTGEAAVSTESSCLSLLSSLISKYDALHHARHSQWYRMTSQYDLHQTLADIQGWYSTDFILCCNAPLMVFMIAFCSPRSPPTTLVALTRFPHIPPSSQYFKWNDKENHLCVAVNKHQLRPRIKSPFSVMKDRRSCDRTPPPDLATPRWSSIIKHFSF